MKLGLKGKITAGVLVVGIVSGSSFAFANTDAGDQLRAWYDGMFGQSVETIETETEAYIDDQVPGLIDEYEALKEDAGIEIDLTRETATGESLDEIIDAKLSHIESIDEEKAEILAGMQQQYYNVFVDGYLEIEGITSDWLDYATNDLNTFTDETGQAAVDQMTTDLNTASDEAVQELEEAIQNAQNELAAAIDTHENMTINNLRNEVDWAIEDLRDNVEALLAGLVEEQQTIIADAAQDLEEDAINALDDVVSGINE